MLAKGPSEADANSAYKGWRQGDIAFELKEFILIATRPGAAAGPDGPQEWGYRSDPVIGFAVVTQTCDIVRDAHERPFVELSPLVQVDPEYLHEIAKGLRPSYAFLPQLAAENLVVDLDRTVTVEKQLLAHWARRPGCLTDEEREQFAAALARKRSRFAFPQDFVDGVRRLRAKIIRQHSKNSTAGQSLRSLREIRVLARPHWGAKEVQLEFFLILEDQPEIERAKIAQEIDGWREFLDLPPRYVDAQFHLMALEDMTAKEYVASQKLDLDNLSGGNDEGR